MQKSERSTATVVTNPWEGLERALARRNRVSWMEKVDAHRYRFHPASEVAYAGISPIHLSFLDAEFSNSTKKPGWFRPLRDGWSFIPEVREEISLHSIRSNHH